MYTLKNKLKVIKKISYESFWVILGQAGGLVGGLFLVRILTEYLDPNQYSSLTLGLTISSLVNYILMGGIAVSAGRYYPIASSKNELTEYLKGTILLLKKATILVLIFLGIGSTTLLLLEADKWIFVVACAGFYSIVSGYLLTIYDIQNAARLRKNIAILKILDSWVKMGVVYTLLEIYLPSASVVIISYIISTCFILLVQGIISNKLEENNIHKANDEKVRIWYGTLVKHSLPFSWVGVFVWLQQVSDRWALEYFTSSEDVGLYSVVYQIGFTPVNILTSLVIGLIAPVLFQKMGDRTVQEKNNSVNVLINKIMLCGVSLVTLLFIICYNSHLLIFKILVSDKYLSYSFLLPWIILISGLNAISQVINLKILGNMMVQETVWPKIVSSLLGVLLNIIGAQYDGVRGVIIASTVYAVFYLIWMYYISLKKIVFSIEK